MPKLRQQIRLLGFFVFVCILLAGPVSGQSSYKLKITPVDKASDLITEKLQLQEEFNTRELCIEYISKLPSLLRSKGYFTASVDSVRFDSASALANIYFGEIYYWKKLDVSGVDRVLLDAVAWKENGFEEKPVDYDKVTDLQNRLLNYLENNGYPFARIYLDDYQKTGDSVSASLKLEKGPLYKIDSIRIYGDAKISAVFLQRYLDLPNGTIFSRQKLSGISGRIAELSYVQEERPYNLSLLGTGSVLNLYLKQKKSSQVNFLIGLLPNNDQLSGKKLLVTGEANINLQNALGAGETIGLNWQRLQVKSPRLNIQYKHPYLFNTSFGLDFNFEMFRKDSSFLNINAVFGARYSISSVKYAKIFFQRFQTIVNEGGINTAQVIQAKQLPDLADVGSSSLGVEYGINKTDYRLNPRKGYELIFTGAAGVKKIKKNSQITDLKDPGDPSYNFESLYDTVKLSSYQVRMTGTAARYFRITRQSVLKMAVNGGLFLSDNIFRNELFQIGGFKLLRGFDEESQYVSQYMVLTAEYRLVIGQNSFFYLFTDGGKAASKSRYNTSDHSYFSTGLGLALETKAGIFNLAWAVGKREDTPFNLRQSKVHFGFINYF